MPSYKKLKKAESQQLCDSRGIDSAGCKTKADLINAIEQHDLRNYALIDENDDGQTEGEDDLEGSGTDEERNGDDDRVDVHRLQHRG